MVKFFIQIGYCF